MASLMDDPAIFKLILDNTPIHIVVTDPKGTIVYANKAVETITEYSLSEIIGATPKLWGGQMEPEFYKNMWAVISNKKVFEGRVQNKKKTGTLYWATMKITPILDPAAPETPIGYIGIEIPEV